MTVGFGAHDHNFVYSGVESSCAINKEKQLDVQRKLLKFVLTPKVQGPFYIKPQESASG